MRLVLLGIVIVVVGLWMLVWRLREWIRSGPPRAIPLPEGSDEDPLVGSIRLLANRVTLNEDFWRTVKKIIAVMVVGAVVGVALVAAVAVLGWKNHELGKDLKAANTRLETLVEAQAQDRQENTIGSCIRSNVQTQNTRIAIADSVIQSLTPLVTTTNGQEFVDNFSRNLHAQVEALLPYRNCSAEGIREFLKNPPPDPNAGH